MLFDGLGIAPARLLLPAAHVPHETWACVACDQYTSQPEYWHEAARMVGDAPSCLKLVLPECFLPETDVRVPLIHQEMRRCVADGDVVPAAEECFILVERTTQSGSRLGLVCAVDLEAYAFTGEKTLVRPTEETIASRLPARLAVRREAPLELSHVLLLADDPHRTVIEPLYARRDTLPLVYDFEAMQGCGHLRGWLVTGAAEMAQIAGAIADLKAQLGENPLLFAVGDGNHSLATAKAHWLAVKPTISEEEQANHPARFAMVEVENIHDPALAFEPIHRVLDGVSADALLQDWAAYCNARGMTLTHTPDEGAQQVILVCGDGEKLCAVQNPDGPIPVATLQRYLDDFLSRHAEVEIDYIHGDDVLCRLAGAPGAVGFLLPPVDKSTFFAAIHTLGTLPRKTFSMGHAHEKRCYMECRAIR